MAMRRFDPRQAQRGPQIRINNRIRVPEVRVVDEDGGMLGILSTQEALRRAQERGLDLVEVNPKADPPVCKILDFGKYKYDEKKKAKEARDFDEDFRQAQHVSTDGWVGIPASAFRNGLISACRLVGFKMTLAKLSLFVSEDGFDSVDAVPLVKIEGTPEPLIMHARNATGVCDIRVRAKFWPWSAKLRISYDGDQFSAHDVANLLQRVGQQVGIGEGRPDSKMSAGMGWGTFTLES